MSACNSFGVNALRRVLPLEQHRNPGDTTSLALSNSPIVRDALDNGLRILSEPMRQVRSVSIGVWLARGSRHESAEQSGIAHFVAVSYTHLTLPTILRV